MRRQRCLTLPVALLIAIILTPLLVGCGGKPAKDQPGAAQKTATQVPGAEAPGGAQSASLDNSLDALADLAPVHTRYFAQWGEDGQTTQTHLQETDLDKNGSMYIKTHSSDLSRGLHDELIEEEYRIGTTTYVPAERRPDSPFYALENNNMDGGIWQVVRFYGIHLMSFGEDGSATLVGSESKNGFATNKYEIAYEAISGISEDAVHFGDPEGEEDYAFYVWIEKSSGALVSSVVDWSDERGTFHAEFDATRVQLDDIQPPDNIIEYKAGLAILNGQAA
ncbi:MAG TPA: hypothetical protein PLJ35_08160 [Anaerolineae bacterium]|nr:hypothetical protein [Anaerolineae bacterium]HOQ98782.1 hypothetical protein [Anaerolineae bacterium]HPL28086.1 hypothetical protein [Anaerolineae bacterium]